MGYLKNHSAPSPMFLIIGYISALIFFGWYFLHDYNLWMSILWIATVGSFCIYFFPQRVRNSFPLLLNKHDLYNILGLYIIFIPVYLWFIYYIPYQVGADELHFLGAIYDASINEKSPDPFSSSNYLGFAKLAFIIFGKIAKNILGEVNFLNLRIVHATCGLLIIIPAYIFYRFYGSRILALGATTLLMSQHALVNISRILSRNNLPVLNILAAFSLLFIGLKRRCPWYSFIGGVVAGFSFYHYCIGRLTFFIWLVFIVVIALFYRKDIPFKVLRKITLVSILGFIITASPIVIQSIYKAPENAFQYGKKQLLLFEEGRKSQRNWHGLSTIEEGIKLNIVNGFTVFNKKIGDTAYQYPNYKHGFVDPLTGIFIWIGLFSLLWRRKKKMEDILILSSFLFLWFVFIFISNTTPNYTRLLIMLPFVAYLTAEGLRVIAYFIGKVFLNRFFQEKFIQSIKNILFILGIVTIVYWNGYMWGDYIKKGLVDGDHLFMGKTLRYVERRMDNNNYMFYTVFDQKNNYFTHGFTGRFEKVVGNRERVPVVPIEDVLSGEYVPPFTIFIHQNHWVNARKVLLEKYPYLKIYSMNIEGSYLAIEVLN